MLGDRYKPTRRAQYAAIPTEIRRPRVKESETVYQRALTAEREAVRKENENADS